MKAAGLFLLLAGFGIVLCTFVVLPSSAPRAAFALAGVGVQVLGLGLTFRAHMAPDEDR